MIKYEIYTKLTEQQKEEYNFKFNKKDELKNASFLFYVLMLQSTATIYLFTNYLYLKEFVEFKWDIAQSFINISSISTVIVGVFLFQLLIDLGHKIYMGVKERQFLKKCGIKKNGGICNKN